MTVISLVVGMLLGAALIFALLAVAVWYLMQDT
jgi:hypothetical protein